MAMVMDDFDCLISVMGDSNTKSLSHVDPARQALQAKAMHAINQKNMDRLGDLEDPYRWVGTLFPTQAYAQDAEMSLAEYAGFVFGACLPTLDQLPRDVRAFARPGADPRDPVAFWEAFSRWQGQLVRYLNARRELHVAGPNIDLRLGFEGRTWWNADGHVNFPDGEVFSGPVEDSVEGWVAFTYPAIFRGHEVRDVRLGFSQGRVVEASAGHGEEYLISMLDVDEGARRLGEFAIGTNPNVTEFTKNTLFDEKIKGTCHMALGASIPGTGGVNQSAIHWDMVCDLRTASRIHADGDLVYENGEFTLQFAAEAGKSRDGVGEGSMAGMFRK
jgi:aminopeptidase